MNIIINDKQDYDKYYNIVSKTINKSIELLDKYHLLENYNVNTKNSFKSISFDDISLEVRFDKDLYRDENFIKDYLEVDYRTNRLSDFHLLKDKDHYLIVIYEKRLGALNNFDNYLMCELAYEFFYVYMHLVQSLNTRESTNHEEAKIVKANIFVCLFAESIGFFEYISNKFDDITHIANRIGIIT